MTRWGGGKRFVRKYWFIWFILYFTMVLLFFLVCLSFICFSKHFFSFSLKVLVFLSKYWFFCNPPLGRALGLPDRGGLSPWRAYQEPTHLHENEPPEARPRLADWTSWHEA